MSDKGKSAQEALASVDAFIKEARSEGAGSEIVANTVPGKGLDIGTGNLVSAMTDQEGDVITRSQRNAFLDLEVNDFIKKMLTKQGVQYIVHQRRFYILGDPAFELANVFNRQTRRPMAKGLISPHEIDALPMIQLLIRQLLGEPTQPNEICYFSVPAEPIDSTMNVTYHREIFAGLLKRMGYKPQDIAEGHAVVFSELAEDNFTGIGISWGAGMANVSVSYMTVPALTFATSRGGDWIDENAA
ncbi:MAG TPA: hypothetical protein VL860_01335, partial [Planctomycetota bacterium]|nr:hypothetical protein [Planctomycetota bacterium]